MNALCTECGEAMDIADGHTRCCLCLGLGKRSQTLAHAVWVCHWRTSRPLGQNAIRRRGCPQARWGPWLDRMPSVEPAIAALVVSPEEAALADAHCPKPQCRAMDDLLCKAYDAAARTA
ncbi:hypothetical protein SKAU_G00133860 [Synaphobranchus kaupii]|uniref:Uncharacterized protein n=1 Tax=Synaphobranchus kaupii TaxID=118154 RepID=A0A9Q1FQX6_SYNKA|nr:hypothetical protein SKAU_G00133860 [Synaphobranchus kaupii]